MRLRLFAVSHTICVYTFLLKVLTQENDITPSIGMGKMTSENNLNDVTLVCVVICHKISQDLLLVIWATDVGNTRNRCLLLLTMFPINTKTSYCCYARPGQPGPIRTRLCRPCIAAIAGD